LSSKLEEHSTISRRIDTIKIERDHFSKKAIDLENKLPTIENDLIRSFSLPTPSTPIHTPISNPSSPTPIFTPPNIYVPPLNPIPIKPKPDILIPPNVTNGSPLPAIVNNNNGNDIYKTIPVPVHHDTPSLPPDIHEVDLQILTSMGFSLEKDREKIYALIRKHKDISMVINELLSS